MQVVHKQTNQRNYENRREHYEEGVNDFEKFTCDWLWKEIVGFETEIEVSRVELLRVVTQKWVWTKGLINDVSQKSHRAGTGDLILWKRDLARLLPYERARIWNWGSKRWKLTAFRGKRENPTFVIEETWRVFRVPHLSSTTNPLAKAG